MCYGARMTETFKDDTRPIHGLFGQPPAPLADIAPDARQFSPMHPGAASLDAVAAGSLAGMVMLAAPGTAERRHDLAAMLVALARGAPFTVMAPKDMGGSRLGEELARFGCDVTETAKRHHRICTGHRSATLPDTIAVALDEGAPRRLDDLGLWSQPGIFSWNRLDPGTALLLATLPKLSGKGADLGCGIGLLAHGVLASPKVGKLDLIDLDRRAVEAARRNVVDPRVAIHWADVKSGTGLTGLDFVVMNPPFHDGGSEDRTLGQMFIRRAAEALRNGGHLWLTANRHLPYETVLKPLFKQVTTVAEANGYKIIEAKK